LNLQYDESHFSGSSVYIDERPLSVTKATQTLSFVCSYWWLCVPRSPEWNITELRRHTYQTSVHVHVIFFESVVVLLPIQEVQGFNS